MCVPPGLGASVFLDPTYGPEHFLHIEHFLGLAPAYEQKFIVAEISVTLEGPGTCVCDLMV